MRGGINAIVDLDALVSEQKQLTPDKKAKLLGKVKNLRARWKLVYSEKAQIMNPEEGKVTIVAFKDVPVLS